jgi:DNA-directed RNA polymerase specialized sigma24 family protein
MHKLTSLLKNVDEFTGFARKRLADPELAADAVQESLLKALKAADQIRDEENAKAWFYRILRRTISIFTAAVMRGIEPLQDSSVS